MHETIFLSLMETANLSSAFSSAPTTRYYINKKESEESEVHYYSSRQESHQCARGSSFLRCLGKHHLCVITMSKERRSFFFLAFSAFFAARRSLGVCACGCDGSLGFFVCMHARHVEKESEKKERE